MIKYYTMTERKRHVKICWELPWIIFLEEIKELSYILNLGNYLTLEKAFSSLINFTMKNYVRRFMAKMLA